MNTKKIIKYVLIVSVVLIVSFFIFFYYLDQKTSKEIIGGARVETGVFGGLFGGGGTENIGTSSEIIGGGKTPSIKEGDAGAFILRLRKISKSPVAGFIVFQKDKEDVAVRYIEKATGHIYEADMNSSNQERVSNTTIPKIYEADWINPTSLVIRYLDGDNHIKSFYGEIKDTKDSKTLEGTFLIDNIKELISAGNQIFYLLESSSGSRGIVSGPSGKDADQIFKSPLTEWLVQRPKKGILSFTTKPSSGIAGYLFFFDVNKGSMDKIFSAKGLTTLTNHNKSTTLFSESSGNFFNFKTYNLKDGSTKSIKPITLPEKCVWNKSNKDVFCGIPKIILKGKYPDDWYQGKVSFSDNIWKLDVENNIYKLLVSPKDYINTDIDLIKPALSEGEKYLFFINKKDSSLWVLNMK